MNISNATFLVLVIVTVVLMDPVCAARSSLRTAAARGDKSNSMSSNDGGTSMQSDDKSSKKNGKKKSAKRMDDISTNEFRGSKKKKSPSVKMPKKSKKESSTGDARNGKGGDDSTNRSSDKDQTTKNELKATETLRHSVNIENIFDHLEALQGIADSADGTRSYATLGFDLSFEYVKNVLTDAGYDVSVQTQFMNLVSTLGDSVLSIPGGKQYVYGVEDDFYHLHQSSGGKVEAPTYSVPNFGCVEEDFVDFLVGSIAVIERGGCSFAVKGTNAEIAGAVGALLYNDEARFNQTFAGSVMGAETLISIPLFGSKGSVGVEVIEAGSAFMFSNQSDATSRFFNQNLIAETPGGDPKQVVMAGAHLDSVDEGPGINDNGSGTATILEIALQMASLGIQPRNKVRFAFWGTEELGLIGSRRYVDGLEQEERENIGVYLNFDMIGSPNWARIIYPPIDEREEKVSDFFVSYFDTFDLPTVPVTDPVAQSIESRSDHAGFQTHGIPTGGLFTGAEAIKSEQMANIFGGVAGESFDQCYHNACDNIDNINAEILDEFADAAAHAILTFANRAEVIATRADGTRRTAEEEVLGDAGNDTNAGHPSFGKARKEAATGGGIDVGGVFVYTF